MGLHVAHPETDQPPGVRPFAGGVDVAQEGLDPVEPRSGYQAVVLARQAQVRPGGDQSVDFGCGEVLEQGRHVEVYAVTVESPALDERVEVGEAADVDAHLDAGVQGRRPPAHQPAHRHAQGPDAAGIHIVPGLEVVD